VLEPLLPALPPERTGRQRSSDRTPFTAIVFVLLTGVRWRIVQKIDCSVLTAKRRLRAWQAAGVSRPLYRKLLRRLNVAGMLE